LRISEPFSFLLQKRSATMQNLIKAAAHKQRTTRFFGNYWICPFLMVSIMLNTMQKSF
jgi:hypothetical protein